MQAGRWRVLGLMSGSSLDGLDLCLAQFEYQHGRWHFHIDKAHTAPYPATLVDRLHKAHLASLPQLQELEVVLGGFFVEACRAFLADVAQPQLISSHGHTILHQPQAGYTLQIGGANQLAAAFKIPVACDFRTADVALGGQGAPLVPVGDALLFSDYAACLNLGGIANVSYTQNGKRLACDLAYANMALNYLSNQLGEAYDAGGLMAASGRYLPELHASLNAWDFYRLPAPKSLGREQFEGIIRPLLDQHGGEVTDKLHTYNVHLAECIANSLSPLATDEPLLITGGGAFNTFLLETLQKQCPLKLVVPHAELVAQKEALIFGFLGLLRYLRLPNVYSSVTGSQADHCAGALIELFP